MGTVVLSPQDCLPSSPNRQNNYFSSMANALSRESSQAMLLSSSPAKDCARKHVSGGSPPRDGLLPIPQPHGQARALLKLSPSEASSSFHTPPSRRISAASVTPKSKLSRSASAILPTPRSGSPPLSDRDRFHLVEGRLPFKIVQGNGPGSPGHTSHHIEKKCAEKYRALKKTPEKCGDKVKEQFDGLKSAVNGLPFEGVTKKQVKQRGRRQSCLEKSQSGKDFRDSCKQSGIPVVTILQRPKNREAAAELIAKYFKGSDEQSFLCVNDESPIMPQKTDGVSEAESSSSGVSDSEGSDTSTCGGGSILNDSSDVPLGKSKNDVEELSVSLAFATDSGSQEPAAVTEATVRSSSLMSGCDDLTLWERWAGPSYVNSPPPSALPLPRFSKKQTPIKCGPLVSTSILKERVSDKAPSDMTSPSTLLSSSLGHQDLAMHFDAFATATKDLKRILNLDLLRI